MPAPVKEFDMPEYEEYILILGLYNPDHE